MEYQTQLKKFGINSHHIVIPQHVADELMLKNEDKILVTISKVDKDDLVSVTCKQCAGYTFIDTKADVYSCPLCSNEILAFEAGEESEF